VRTAVIVLIVLVGFTQYALMYLAMRDLVSRPRVRGGNKVVWAIVVLCIPILGAILYDWSGKTGFRTRSARSSSLARRELVIDESPLPDMPPANVTSIRTARSFHSPDGIVIPLRSGPRPLPIRETFAGPAANDPRKREPTGRSIARPTAS
jgi:hypothetical protein